MTGLNEQRLRYRRPGHDESGEATATNTAATPGGGRFRREAGATGTTRRRGEDVQQDRTFGHGPVDVTAPNGIAVPTWVCKDSQ